MIAELAPRTLAVVEHRGAMDSGGLWPEEETYVERAVPARRAEFATGRRLARAALARLGVPERAVPVGPRREPCWPPGIVGSITHTSGFAAVAVARRLQVRTVGVDVEPLAPLEPAVAERVARPEEIAGVGVMSPGVAARLVFSAKEAVYKAWYPVSRRWLDFFDVEVTFERDRRFVATVLVPAPTGLDRFEGRVTWDTTHLASLVVLPPRDLREIDDEDAPSERTR